MSLIDPRHRLLFFALFGIFTIFGTFVTIFGATLPKILAGFGWSYFTAGLVLGAGSIAYFTATFLAGALVKHYGAKLAILLGLGLAALGMLFFAATPDPLTNMLLCALIGVGQGCLEVGANWATLRIDTEGKGRPMSLMHSAFAFGAILGPIAVGLLLQAGLEWVTVYRGIAVIIAALALLAVPLNMQLGHTAPSKAAAPQRLRRNPAYWISFLGLFCFVGVELGLSGWIAEYFVQVFAYQPSQSAFLVSLFWVGMLAGRLGVPLLYHGPHQAEMLIALSGLATLSTAGLCLLGLMVASGLTQAIGLGLVFLAGLGCSIYYPAVISLLGKRFPQAQSQAIAFAATGGGIGAFVFPFVMSALAQGWGIRFGFAAYVIVAIAMTLAAIGLWITEPKR
ncbi:MAG: MFS transporter [Pseudomonadota bacterium]